MVLYYTDDVRNIYEGQLYIDLERFIFEVFAESDEQFLDYYLC